MTALSRFGAVWREPSFNDFIKLPKLVRYGLVWGVRQQDAGRVCETRDVSQWIIDHYDMNQTLPIGSLLRITEDFIQENAGRRMVRCYIDHGCNMMAAKLAWSEDY